MRPFCQTPKAIDRTISTAIMDKTKSDDSQSGIESDFGEPIEQMPVGARVSDAQQQRETKQNAYHRYEQDQETQADYCQERDQILQKIVEKRTLNYQEKSEK